LRAAAYLRGEEPPPVDAESFVLPPDLFAPSLPPFEEVEPPPDFDSGGRGPRVTTRTIAPPLTVVATPSAETKVVGQPKAKVDAVKLAKGRPVFTDDFALPGMLYGALFTSPHAHARILRIDASAARKLPGVHAVLTYEDVPRVPYASGGQSYPNPLPYDQFSLDNKVRHVGDRVAVVAAETPEIAQKALTLVEVDYEMLPAVLDPEEAMQPDAPVIHDELDAVGIYDAARNIVHHIHVDHGHLEAGFAEADYIFENEYRVHQVQHAQIEPHVCITYWDEDDRLTVRTSTQVPFHTRRMLAPLIGLPLRRIRVIKPRIGCGFGGKQEMLLEDLCAHLTIATGRPVRMEDGTLAAMQLRMIGDTGAYGTHGLTVQFVAGFRGLTTYKADALQFDCHVVYTNKPVAGAYRGYGAPQAEFALESHMEEIAVALGLDPVEFKRLNWVKEGDELVLARAMGEGREGFEQWVTSSGLEECVRQGAKAIGWERRNMGDAYRLDPAQPHIRRGLGMAVAMHGSSSTTMAALICWSVPPIWALALIRSWPRSRPRHWVCRWKIFSFMPAIPT